MLLGFGYLYKFMFNFLFFFFFFQKAENIDLALNKVGRARRPTK